MTVNQDRRVFIVVGLYRPDPVLLARQLQSLAAQTHRNLEILVCADGLPDSDSQSVVADFTGVPVHILEFDERVGIHANFARGLRAAVAASQSDSDLFAFCDQDDVWHPTKLERQLACFADAQTSLCHSDARIVSRQGDVLVTSLFEHEHRSRAASLADLLIMNSVSGMTAVFRRDVAVAAATFPLSKSPHILHDHWTAMVASLLGTIRFIDAPLIDYTQHAANVMGARRWAGAPRRGAPSRHRTYLRKCYREFLWRRHALDELRGAFGHVRGAEDRLSGKPVRALFDCDSSWMAGPVLSLVYRLRGLSRQADQVWRIWRGKSLSCP